MNKRKKKSKRKRCYDEAVEVSYMKAFILKVHYNIEGFDVYWLNQLDCEASLLATQTINPTSRHAKLCRL